MIRILDSFKDMAEAGEVSVIRLYENNEILVECLTPEGCKLKETADASFHSRFALIPVQTHSLDVATVSRHTSDRPDTDALLTFLPSFPIGVVTADCVPIILHAPDIKGVAAVHAGWKGTLGGIVRNAVTLLISEGADPERMVAVFGPSISARIYEVSRDLGETFMAAGFGDHVYEEPGSKPHIDLQGVNVDHLRSLGLNDENILLSPYCSYSSVTPEGGPLFPSHRRSGGNPDRMLTRVTIKPA